MVFPHVWITIIIVLTDISYPMSRQSKLYQSKNNSIQEQVCSIGSPHFPYQSPLVIPIHQGSQLAPLITFKQSLVYGYLSIIVLGSRSSPLLWLTFQ